MRVILHNERYRGVVQWNTSEWRKDPDTGKRTRVMRPRAEWITHVDESLRIVSDDLWERAQRRSRPAPDDVRLKAGGKPKYLLSGLLRCGLCDAHYTITDAKSYGCSSYHDGNACSNAIRVRRERVEAILLGPLNENLGNPDRVARMVAEMEAYYLERLRVLEARDVDSPRELQELSARILRLKERLRCGDPDMTGDELQAAIDRAEMKWRALQSQAGPGRSLSKLFATLPRGRSYIAARSFSD